MKNLILLAGMLLLMGGYAFGQGTVRGKIIDETGEPVVGAIIVLKSDMSKGAVTDFDGNYSLKISETTPQVLVVSYISYEKQELEIGALISGQVIIKNITLKTASHGISEVVIEAKQLREKDSYMEKMKMNSATTIDYISSETIKKTGDSYVVAAVARVSGVSTTSNGFITVRGIGDRYVKTTLNGSMIPTLDPFTNNIQLDIFPTSLIDNVTLSKTARPDLPGDWAGAYISVLTKDYPDQLTVNVETTFGYNSQSTFNEILTSQRSSTDWLGFDNNFRDIDHNSYVPVNAVPSEYDEFVALGLQQYYNSIGVTGDWLPGSNAGETYFKLGLIELGLLGAAQFNDAEAIAAAKQLYFNGPYESLAFNTINANGVKSAQALPNNWNTTTMRAPLDFSQSLSVGNQVDLFGRPLGFLAGFRYGNSFRYDPNSTANRAYVDVEGNNGVESEAVQQASRESNGWSGLLNLAYKLNSNNSVSVLFMPNFTGVNKVRNTQDVGTSQSYEYTLIKSQFYEERKQLIYQFKSEHYLPLIKSKIDFNASYTDGESSAPDFKELTYFQDQGQYLIDIKESDTHRYYRYLDDNLFDSQLSLEIPLMEKPGLSRKLKLGGSYSKSDRTSNQYDYKVIYNGGGDLIIDNNDIDAFFALDQFGISTDSSGESFIDKYYERSENPADNTFGYSEVIGAFAMADYNLTHALRITGGLRVEKANVFTDVYKYDQLGYEANDPRRQYPGEIFTVNPGALNELSFLPSIGLVYKINQSEDTPFNLRANFSQSVARPSIRELSDAIVYDYEVQDYIFGNSNLKMVTINNFDLRLEYYFKNRDNVSVSPFYKDFKNHIELVNTNQGFTWQNVDKSTVRGIEVEGRKKLGRNFELLANVTFVKSSTEFILYRLEVEDGLKKYVPIDTVKRAMYGQAPFVINGIINYTSDTLGLSLSLSYNIQGNKLVLTSTNGTPDIYEMPRHQLDFKASKTLGKHFGVSFKINNILNESVRRSYLYEDDSTLDFDKYTFGTNYTLGFSYRL